MSEKTKAVKTKKALKDQTKTKPDDFESVARRLGADDDKGRFEAKLKKIARATSTGHSPPPLTVRVCRV